MTISTTIRSAILAIGIAGATAIPALAHDTTPVNRTQSWQMQQIEQSRRSGELTRREYRELLAEQGRIERMTENAERDGNVTGREYRAIREAQREAGAHIYNESHDNQVNWLRRWRVSRGY
jgi:hypothetical protein